MSVSYERFNYQRKSMKFVLPEFMYLVILCGCLKSGTFDNIKIALFSDEMYLI